MKTFCSLEIGDRFILSSCLSVAHLGISEMRKIDNNQAQYLLGNQKIEVNPEVFVVVRN